jgi:cyanophycinase
MDNYVNGCPVPKGVLLVIGGHEDKNTNTNEEADIDQKTPEILKTFVELIPKQDSVVEVITSASGEGNESFQVYRKCLETLGVKHVGHIHHNTRAEVLKTDFAERLKKADGIFFSGGDQLRLTSLYGGTELLLQIKLRYITEPVVIAGTSAGAMAFSTPMIFAGDTEVHEIAGAIRMTTGLEFMKDVCIDTHFVNRSRFVRMAQVIATNPTCIGVGIEENTAMIVRNGKEAEVIGCGIVTVMEGLGITNSNITKYESEKTITIHDLNVRILSKGSSYQIPCYNPPHH